MHKLGPVTIEEWLKAAAAPGDPAVAAAQLAPEARATALEQLVIEIGKAVYSDNALSERLLALAEALSGLMPGSAPKAHVAKARGHLLFQRSQPAGAVEQYERAIALFGESGQRIEVARCMSSGAQSLIYLGRYPQAEVWIDTAAAVFTAAGDWLRLARLDSNRGNVLYRQDRYLEALEAYERAKRELQIHGDVRDVASVVTNTATVLISMGRFEDALASYREARRLCTEAGLQRMAAQADYNIAYLHYLRGDYLRAIDIYRHARILCHELNDPYHEALCDLDEAEMYLELNLSREGARLARRAAVRFKALDMNYERAKAMVSEAVSLHHVGAAGAGRTLMRKARVILSYESNHVWPALIDLYLAISFLSEDRTAMAGRLASRASARLAEGGLPGKSALCDLVTARVRLRSGRAADARALCLKVLGMQSEERLPSIDYLAWFTLGEVEEHQGNWRGAWDAWQRTREAIDRLRNSLGGEDLRISFLKDKVEVYENMVWLWMARLSDSGQGPSAESLLVLLQEAKSRSLADLLDAPPAAGKRPGGAASGEDSYAQMRSELVSLYRRIEAAMLTSGATEAKVRRLTEQARAMEEAMTVQLRDQSQAEAVSARPVRRTFGAGSKNEVQSALPKDAQLVEYFAAKGNFIAAVVTHRRIEFVELGPVAPVAEKVRLVRFQLAKFRLDPEHLQRFAPRLRDAIQTHLRGLYDELVRPLRRKLREGHLAISPYGVLHQLPFHALADGEKCLGDDYTISYAPSGAVLAACLQRPPSSGTRSLVFGVPDSRSPAIEAEARRVAELLPNSELFLGDDATERRLRELTPDARVLHVATHGFFRRDNPLFSAIRLGDGFLSLFDLYRLDLGANLVTLSGCSTGVSAVVGGDEVLGLTRGLLHAGARAVLLSLWDVQDVSTAEYMACFYEKLAGGCSAAVASHQAVRQLRSRYEHPFYWAPFHLIGDWRVKN